MNTCTNCGRCADTGCTCPAKVAPYKPLDGGNVWFAEPEPEPWTTTDYVLAAVLAGMLCGFWYGVYQYFLGV